MGILITWSELTGIKPTKELMRERLAPFVLQSVLLGLARISSQLNTWQVPSNSEEELKVARQTLPTYYHAIERLTAATSDRVVFCRISILYVARQALFACRLDGNGVQTEHDVEQIMTCCLMANDLFLGREPSPTDTVIDKAASLLPFSNYLPHADDPLDIARNLILINEIAPTLVKRSDYRDLAAEFNKATGFSPQTFCELVYGTATKFLARLDEQNNATGRILTPDYFQHTRVKDALSEFLTEYTTSIAELQATALRTPSLDDDFLLFQERPLIEFAPSQYLCIDPGFLLDKAGRSFYWTLHNKTPSDARVHLLGYWATVVEAYAQWLVRQCYRGRGSITNSPRFANNDEACDLMLREGARLILFEIKACTLTAKAKYSFDAGLLDQELRRKALVGEEGERKGIAQLHRTIQRFQDGESINGLISDDIKWIYPVIVFLDRSFVSPYLGTLYREHFDRSQLKRRPTTTAPYAITISDLESVLPHTANFGVTEIIDDYYRHNRTPAGTLAFGRLADGKIPLLQNQPRGKDVVRERFEQFHNDLISNMFPPEVPT